MSELHQTQAARRFELTEELILSLRGEGLPWDTVLGYMTSAVDHYRDKEEHPEDYDYGDLDEDTGVYQLAPPFCRLDDGEAA